MTDLKLSQGGIHEFRTKPMPDAQLQALNPQWMVVVGSAEHPDTEAKTRTYVQSRQRLLPHTTIGVRWWDDNKLATRLLRVVGGDVEKAADLYAEGWFPKAIPGTWMLVGNEEESSQSDPAIFGSVVAVHTAIVRRANAAGIPLGVLCMAMGEPGDYAQYDLYAPLFIAMDEGRRQANPVYHLWRPNTYFPHLKVPESERESLIYHLAQRHQREGRRVAAAAGVPFPPTAFGELNTVVSLADNFNGPNAMELTADEWIDSQLDAGIDLPYAIYCYGDGYYDDRWRSFDLRQRPTYITAMIDRLPRRPKTLLDEWRAAVASPKKYMPRMICPTNGRTGKLIGLGEGEAIQSRLAADNWLEFAKNRQYEAFRIQNGMVERGEDTSELYTVDGLYHGHYYIQYRQQPHNAQERLAYYGAPWCPVWFAEGDSFVRDCYVIRYWWDGRIKEQGRAITTLRFVKFYDSFTVPNSGIQLKNVARLNYGGEEDYYYGEDIGLVGWRNLRTGAESWLAILDGVPQLAVYKNGLEPRPAAQKPPAYPTEPEMPPVPAPPDRAQLGAQIDGIVEAVKALYANVRETPTQAARILRRVYPNDRVRYHPIAYPTEPELTVEGYKWTALDPEGWVADVATIVPDLAEEWMELPLPFVSQTDADANLNQNDCLIASLLMVTRLDHLQHGHVVVPVRPRVDDLVGDTRLVDPTVKSLNFVDGEKLAKLLGYRTRYIRPLTNSAIVDWLRQGRSPIVLVDYGVLFPGQPSIPHLLPVKGFSATRFKLNDPYLMGPNVVVDATRLDAAMKTVPNNFYGYQGLVLDEGVPT